MVIAAFIVSIIALLAAGWSAWGTHRQARATEAQARSADAANHAAQEALALAKAAEARDRARQHAEEHPSFDVAGTRQRNMPTLIELTVKNGGRLKYDAVTVAPDLTDPETTRLLRGVRVHDSLADEAALGSVHPGETIATVLVRTSPELGGKAKIIVTTARGEHVWTTVHYIDIARPARFVVA